ncbi:MAG: magnesium transporter [Clostridia bacterium]|nr:magnesium transporter [Clostridia bacterium]
MQTEILSLISEKKFLRLRETLSDLNPTDIAEFLEEADKKDLPVVFRILPKELAAEVFVQMDSDMQQHLIESFSDSELKDVIDELFMDDMVNIIEEMPASVAKRILKQTNAKTRQMINKLLAYPDTCAGSIMTTEYINIKKSMTVDEAFNRIRKNAVDTEAIYTCYVTDRGRKLLGVVTVRELLLSYSDTLIEDIMDTNIISAGTLDDREEVVNLFERYDLYTLPIVDTENRLVGVITVDDAIDVMQEEASEDIEKMAAILPSEKSYLKTGVFSTFKSRIPWLLFLMISATFTGAIISSFEDRLSKWIGLIAFIPMLMGTGGNSGSQSSVTIIRALSLGDIDFKDIWRVIWKELRVAVICGIVLGAVNFVKLYLVDYLILKSFDEGVLLLEMTAVSLTLVFVVIIAKLVGSVLPIIAKKLGFDPAVMASPLVTTILDALSLLIYFSIAILLLM